MVNAAICYSICPSIDVLKLDLSIDIRLGCLDSQGIKLSRVAYSS